jgi:mRNA interferase RelE/StbE
MASYQVEFAKNAQKDLKKIPSQQVAKIIAAIDKLALEPLHSNSKKLVDWENTYRIRVGDYRVLYELENSVLIVFVVEVGHRKDIYR